MARTRGGAGNRDGITIRDQWAAKRQRRGKRWLYRCWDPTVRKYEAQAFANAPEDGGRRTPGCADGDRWAEQRQARFRLGLDSASEAPAAAIIEEYARSLEDLRRNPRHVREVRRVLGDLAKSGAIDLKARDFRAKVEDWRRKLKARAVNEPKEGEQEGRRRRVKVFDLSRTTINRYTQHVRSLCQFALDREYLVRNPLARLKDLDEPDTLKATFTIAELRALVALDDVTDASWLWLVLMAFTGCRSGESLHLRWEWIDTIGKQVVVRAHAAYKLKRGKERTLPLTEGLAAILAKCPRRPDLGWIIADKSFREADNKTQWAAATKTLQRAGIIAGERTPHSFRHTYAAIMVATGQHVFATCAAMGHSDLKMTQHYAREAASYRTIIEREGWKPGELRFHEVAANVASGPS